MKTVRIENTFESWRHKARQLLSQNVHFNDIDWNTGETSFSFNEEWQDIEVTSSFHVSKKFMNLALVVSAFRDPSIWNLLYRSLYRLTFENHNLLDNPLDSDVMDIERKFKLVNRDIHKMKAFVRFKEIKTDTGSVFMAWHNPDHRIIRLAAPFFKDRFNGMKWVIMTRDETANWDGDKLTFTPGVSKEEAPNFDAKEDLWKTYYRAIFNPARIKISAMKKELPVRHWQTLPEAELITGLINEAPDRLETFYESQRHSPLQDLRSFQNLDELNQSLLKCRACGICEKASAPVPGEGPDHSRMMVIGEQPGDEEDKLGRPFIGPAGRLLDQTLKASKIERSELYLTNAVKGFKFLPKAHQRWHKGASISEIKTCSGWLKKEIELIKPEIIVCLGRSAALSVVGKMVKIEEVRGKFFESALCPRTVILPHPASILRSKISPEDELARFRKEWEMIRSLT